MIAVSTATPIADPSLPCGAGQPGRLPDPLERDLQQRGAGQLADGETDAGAVDQQRARPSTAPKRTGSSAGGQQHQADDLQGESEQHPGAAGTDLRVAVSGAEMNDPRAVGSTTSCACSGDRPRPTCRYSGKQEQDAEFAEGDHQDRRTARGERR